MKFIIPKLGTDAQFQILLDDGRDITGEFPLTRIEIVCHPEKPTEARLYLQGFLPNIEASVLPEGVTVVQGVTFSGKDKRV